MPLTDPDITPDPPEPPRWSAQRQAWVLSSYADLQAALRQRTMAAPNPRAMLAAIEARTGRAHTHLAAVLDGTMLFQTGLRHAASRQLMRHVLGAVSQSWTRDALHAAAGAIVAALPEEATLDVATDLADMLPCHVAGEMLGITPDRLRRLRGMSQQVTTVWRPMPPLREYARLEALCAQTHAELDSHPPCLHGGTVSGLDYPIADLVLFLTIAAVDSTASTIAAGLDLLARAPDMQARLRAEPGLVDGFVTETLRLAGPLRRLNDRITTEPTGIGGIAIPANCVVILQVDRAHRDPAAFSDPHAVDLARHGPPLAAFGGGAHACQGAMLGRAQVAAMLRALLKHFTIIPAPGRRALADNSILYQFETLPLRLARLPA